MAKKKQVTRKKPVSKKKTSTAKKITRPKKPALRKARKTQAKRTAPGKLASKKPAAKKLTFTKKAANRKPGYMKQVIARFPADNGDVSTRRPPVNPELPEEFVEDMGISFSSYRNDLEDFSAHLRSLDRRRLNGVGIKKLGFIGRALQLAAENPEFLPHWLPLRKFQHDNNYFLSLRSVFDILKQVQEILWNIIIEASDVLYTDALEYYSQVGDAAKRRIDPAESLHAILKPFFERPTMRKDAEPTDKQLRRDFEALLKGRKNGELLIENTMPKTKGGSRKVIDETFKDSASVKESKRGEIEE